MYYLSNRYICIHVCIKGAELITNQSPVGMAPDKRTTLNKQNMACMYVQRSSKDILSIKTLERFFSSSVDRELHRVSFRRWWLWVLSPPRSPMLIFNSQTCFSREKKHSLRHRPREQCATRTEFLFIEFEHP